MGNHEFDDGVQGLTPFLQNISFPMVCTNCNLTQAPDLKDLIKKSLIVEVQGTKIGILGFVTPDTELQSKPKPVTFEEESQALNEEIARMKQEDSNLQIFIGLGHSGYERDQKIAQSVPDLDLVVGGHTNSFLFSGKTPGREEAVGKYPTIFTRPSGKKVLVVQAYAYTKYLGHLKMTFDDKGDLKSWEGNPILLSQDMPQGKVKLCLKSFNLTLDIWFNLQMRTS